tara:strand:- start:55 stop:318 length:264 start_codon:yes stop_codon:yes gene_type:complete
MFVVVAQATSEVPPDLSGTLLSPSRLRLSVPGVLVWNKAAGPQGRYYKRVDAVICGLRTSGTVLNEQVLFRHELWLVGSSLRHWIPA